LMKSCTVCKISKPHSEFYRNKHMANRALNQCKRCVQSAIRARRRVVRNDPALWSQAQLSKRRRYERRVYGVTKDVWYEMFGSECAICAVDVLTLPVNQRCFDHCHTSGRVRGILCHRCNSAMGKFEDDPALLERAAQFLRGCL
jgi:hypothetical protein